MGLAYLETGRLGGAIAALHAALDSSPTIPNLLYYFGRATDLAAKRSFDQACETQPRPGAPQHRPRITGTNRASRPQDVVSLQTRSQSTPR
jgi:predicted Zn-dependent protease